MDEYSSAWSIVHSNEMWNMESTLAIMNDIMQRRQRRAVIDLERNEVKYIEAREEAEAEAEVKDRDGMQDWSAYENM